MQASWFRKEKILMAALASSILVFVGVYFNSSKSHDDGNLRQEIEIFSKPGQKKTNLSGAKVISMDLATLRTPESVARYCREIKNQRGSLDVLKLWFSIDEKGAMESVMQRAINEWLQHGIAFTIDMIGAIPDEGIRENAIYRCSNAFPNDPEAFIAAAKNMLNPASRRAIIATIFQLLPETDPSKGLEIIESLGQGTNKDAAITAFFSKYSKIDSGAALASIQKLSFEEDKKAAYEALSSALSKTGINAVSFLQNESLPETYKKIIADGVIKDTYSKEGVDGLLKAFGEYPKLGMSRSTAVVLMFQDDWDKAFSDISILQKNGLVDYGKDFNPIFSLGVNKDPQKVIDSVLGAENSIKSIAVPALAQNLASSSDHYEDCLSLIRSLPTGQIRDSAIFPLIKALEKRREEDKINQIKAMLSK